MRLTGLDLKMEQYAAGERFADAVIRDRDRAFLNRVWSGPEMLPTLEEIREPGALDRACGVAAAAAVGRRLLSGPTTVLATPILGVAAVERARRAYRGVEGVRCERIDADGRIHGEADETVLAEADILLLGAVPVSVLDHVVVPRAEAAMDPLRLGRSGSHLDPVGPRARADRHERPRRLQQADRRVRRDDVAGHRPTASAAPGAPARADLAAAARAGAVRADGRDRRLREHRRGGRPPAPAVRLPHPGDTPPSRPRRARASSSSASRTSARCCGRATSSSSPRRSPTRRPGSSAPSSLPRCARTPGSSTSPAAGSSTSSRCVGRSSRAGSAAPSSTYSARSRSAPNRRCTTRRTS